MNINLQKLNKNQLINIIKAYEFNIDVLDVMLNDMTYININDVADWLNYLSKDIETAVNLGGIYINLFTNNNELTKQDIENGYKQTKLELET